MDRKLFLKSACGLGFCSCFGAGLLSNGNLLASEQKAPDWFEGFAKRRFASLIDILDSDLDENSKNKVLENLGRECAKEGNAAKFAGDLEGFFKDENRLWGSVATYDKEKGIIRSESAEMEYCGCPFVDRSKVSKSLCQCSVGAATQAYKAVLGKEVRVECIESVLKGGKKCVFEILIL